jgi:hypothetical protein
VRRFADVISRQLDLFESDGLLAEAHEAKSRYDRAGRDEAEEAYGDYVDVVDATKDALADMRDRYAATLDADAAEEYATAFERAATKRWRWLG